MMYAATSRSLYSWVLALVLLSIGGGRVSAETATADGLERRVEQLDLSLQKLTEQVESLRRWSVKDTVAAITAITALFAVAVSFYAVWLNRKTAIQTLTHKANEEQATAIQDKLDTFYGPLKQLLKQSELLYRILKSGQPDPDNFRALTALLQGHVFGQNDKAILEEIIAIGAETETLIKTASGLVDQELQEVLGLATSHYRVMRLALAGTIRGDPKVFEAYIFPRHIGGVIDTKITLLRDELLRLRTVGS